MRAAQIEKEIQNRNKEQEKAQRYRRLKENVKNYQKEFNRLKNDYERKLLKLEQEEQFIKNARELCCFLSEERRWEELFDVCEQISRYCPRDEWSWDQIEALLNMERYGEARALHQRSMQEYFGEGKEYSMERRNAFCWLGELIDRIDEHLQEKKVAFLPAGDIGANQCSPGDFADLLQYTIQTRQGGYLMICTLIDKENASTADRKHTYEKIYGGVLQKSLRKRDYYTISGGGQVQILLPRLGAEVVESVADRLKKHFRRACKGKGEVEIRYLDISGWIELDFEGGEYKEMEVTSRGMNMEGDEAS